MAIVYCPIEGWHSKYTGPAKCVADDPRVRQWGDAGHSSFFCLDSDAPAFVAMYGPQQVQLGGGTEKDAEDNYSAGI